MGSAGYSIDMITDAANASTDFENTNTELKKQYLAKNIQLYNKIVQEIVGFRGSFGTGYPFTVLNGGRVAFNRSTTSN